MNISRRTSGFVRGLATFMIREWLIPARNPGNASSRDRPRGETRRQVLNGGQGSRTEGVVPTMDSESGLPSEPVFGPVAPAGFDPATALGEPGQFPYTRGVNTTKYTSRPWTLRQYAGFGTA